MLYYVYMYHVHYVCYVCISMTDSVSLSLSLLFSRSILLSSFTKRGPFFLLKGSFSCHSGYLRVQALGFSLCEGARDFFFVKEFGYTNKNDLN